MSKILVAGSAGMVGSAIARALEASAQQVIRVDRTRTDLTQPLDVDELIKTEHPDAIVIAAAKVGGIHANNTYPVDFLLTNLNIQNNLISAAHRHGTPKLVFLGSSCIYPRNAAQPMQENALLTGELEKTNEPYAIAKIAGIKLCESYRRQYQSDFRSLMPTNLYGTGDNFHPTNSHVLPALLRRFHEAKVSQLPSVTVWGTGNARREFLHVDDLAQAVVAVLNLTESSYWNTVSTQQSHLNVGTGEDVTIGELAHLIREVVEYEGELTFDTSKPDGTPRKLLDISKIRSIGWSPQMSLSDGLKATYRWYLDNHATARH